MTITKFASSRCKTPSKVTLGEVIELLYRRSKPRGLCTSWLTLYILYIYIMYYIYLCHPHQSIWWYLTSRGCPVTLPTFTDLLITPCKRTRRSENQREDSRKKSLSLFSEKERKIADAADDAPELEPSLFSFFTRFTVDLRNSRQAAGVPKHCLEIKRDFVGQTIVLPRFFYTLVCFFRQNNNSDCMLNIAEE